MPTDVQTNYGISFTHAQWFSCRKSRADNHNVIKWHHSDCLCYWGREVYRGSELKPWGCHLGFWHWTVGSIVKYYGYIGASCGARVYPGWTVYLVYSCACTQTFGNTLVSMTLVVWQLVRLATTCIPLNPVLSKAHITTFCSRLHRQDKSLLWCESPPIHLAYLCMTPCHISGIPGLPETEEKNHKDLVWRWELWWIVTIP